MKNVWMNLQKEKSKFPMRGKEILDDLIYFSNSNFYLNLKNSASIYIRGLTKIWDHSGVWHKVSLVFMTLCLKFQKATSKTEAFLSQPCWLSQFNWLVGSQSPNVSTTPITAMGCQQCLPLSIVQLKGKHCRKLHCRNRVVDMFGQ